MQPNLTSHRRRVALMGILIGLLVLALTGRLGYLMLFQAEHYGQMAEDLHQRERTIKAGDIIVSLPGEAHGMTNTGDEDVIMLGFATPMPLDFIPYVH